MINKIRLPRKYQLQNLSLIDEDGCDYINLDIVRYVLKPEQAGYITKVTDLDQEQKDILIGVLIETIKEKNKRLMRYTDY